MEKRPVVVLDYSEWNPEKRRHDKKERCKGEFHRWGSELEEFENGANQYSTAIIELENGDVLNHPVELIKFTDK